MLGTSRAGNVAEVAMKVLVREGATTLSHRVIDRLLRTRTLKSCRSTQELPMSSSIFVLVITTIGPSRSSATVEGEALMEEVRRVSAPGGDVVVVACIWTSRECRIPITEDEVIRPGRHCICSPALIS